MKSYRVAFDEIYTVAELSDYFKDFHRKDLDIIEELVERATLKKPNQTVFNAYCPNCGEALGRQFAIDGINGSRFRQYCPTCGQALDWELEEVKE